MKEFLYILFCVVILGLGILLLNSKGGDNQLLSEYPVYVSPGVDFSKMNNIKSTYVPQNRSQNSTRSLIGSDLNKKSLSVGNTSSLYSENVNTTPSAISSPIYGGSIGYRANQRNMQNNGDVGPLASSFLTNRSGSGGQVIGSQQGSNLLSSGSATSTSFRSFVPMNPNTDYREGDITHPGGNPMADSLVSVPVGEGIIPLFLMSISYILILLLRRKF